MEDEVRREVNDVYRRVRRGMVINHVAWMTVSSLLGAGLFLFSWRANQLLHGLMKLQYAPESGQLTLEDYRIISIACFALGWLCVGVVIAFAWHCRKMYKFWSKLR